MVTATTTTETLGGRSVLKERLADYTAVIHRARSGLPFASLAAVGTRYDIPLLTLARVVGLPARTLARRKKERRLRGNESDRLPDTDLGAEELVTVLGRIEHGVYS
jgi:uncharacterized protein (DUF2384 family)